MNLVIVYMHASSQFLQDHGAEVAALNPVMRQPETGQFTRIFGAFAS